MTSVSVIVTVLNEESTIEKLLKSLLAQTYPMHEVIITDGGSTDSTIEVLTRFQEQHPQFPLSFFEVKGNRSKGRNFAIEKASSKVIAITDAGCIPHLNWLTELINQYDAHKKMNEGLVIAGYYDAKPKTAFEAAVVPYVFVMPDKVNSNTFLPATRSMLIEKSVWKELGGFNEKLRWNEDYEFAKRLEKHKIRIVFAKAAVVSWLPTQTLSDFYKMIQRFAKGDVQARIWRKKVQFIFIRYILGVLGLIFLVNYHSGFVALSAFMLGLLLYSGWAIWKNSKYVSNGKWWLPILQITSDLAVMSGSLSGLV